MNKKLIFGIIVIIIILILVFVLSRKSNGKIHLDNDLIIDNVKIDQKSQTKFLGVIIDEQLSFKQHIRCIKGKVSRGLGILHKCKRFLNHNSLMQLYNSFIYPYLNYCICVWGSACQTYLQPLITLQKKIILRRYVYQKVQRET